MNRLIGIKELSELLGIKPSTLYSYTFRKSIPHLKIGGLVKFDPEEIGEQIAKLASSKFEFYNKTTQPKDTSPDIQPQVNEILQVGDCVVDTCGNEGVVVLADPPEPDNSTFGLICVRYKDGRESKSSYIAHGLTKIVL